ncbi:MAG: GNAT family N-acetyltransferase [Halovenus sp.]
MDTVRPYRENDAASLWELKQAFERELGTETGDDAKARAYEAKLDGTYRDEYLDWVRRCTEEHAGTVQVAERDGTLVGYVFVLPSSLSYIWDSAVLNELFVREPHRGTGVGDDLLGAALAVAREQPLPMDRIVLDVDPGNERAVAFYERWGFEDWGTLVARKL